MFDTLLSFIAPNHCYLCTISGAILCKSCIYNIVNETENHCFGCQRLSMSGVCAICASKLPFGNAYAVGERKNELEKLLDDFKFNRAYRIHETLGALLNERLPVLPETTVIVPIPTIAKHIRIRGYDHTDIIARNLAKRRGLKKSHLLRRLTNTVQLGATARVRREQAKSAYGCTRQLDKDTPYLLIDDIATTGATLIAAADCLRQAGAKIVIVAVIARQPLDSKSNIH